MVKITKNVVNDDVYLEDLDNTQSTESEYSSSVKLGGYMTKFLTSKMFPYPAVTPSTIQPVIAKHSTRKAKVSPNRLPVPDMSENCSIDEMTTQRILQQKRWNGTVKFFRYDLHFGFIVLDGLNCNIFVHLRSIVGNEIHEHDRVTFDVIKEYRKGKDFLVAENVTGGSGKSKPKSKKLCHQYIQCGECSFGDACMFQHNDEYREKIKLTPKVSMVCFQYKHGQCLFGQNCKFLHHQQTQKRCLDYARGNCSYGNECRFLHGNEEHLKEYHCFQNLIGQKCKFGTSCIYLHQANEPQCKFTCQPCLPLCKYFREDNCEQGIDFNFHHHGYWNMEQQMLPNNVLEVNSVDSGYPSYPLFNTIDNIKFDSADLLYEDWNPAFDLHSWPKTNDNYQEMFSEPPLYEKSMESVLFTSNREDDIDTNASTESDIIEINREYIPLHIGDSQLDLAYKNLFPSFSIFSRDDPVYEPEKNGAKNNNSHFSKAPGGSVNGTEVHKKSSKNVENERFEFSYDYDFDFSTSLNRETLLRIPSNFY